MLFYIQVYIYFPIFHLDNINRIFKKQMKQVLFKEFFLNQFILLQIMYPFNILLTYLIIQLNKMSYKQIILKIQIINFFQQFSTPYL